MKAVVICTGLRWVYVRVILAFGFEPREPSRTNTQPVVTTLATKRTLLEPLQEPQTTRKTLQNLLE